MLTESKRVVGRLRRALNDLGSIVEGIEDVDELVALLAELDYTRNDRAKGVYQTLAVVLEDVKLRCSKLMPSGKLYTVTGVGTIQRSGVGGSDAWEGQRLAHQLAARCADKAMFDPTTGERRDEPMPYGAFAEMVAQEIVTCAGLDAASKSWRKEELRKRGLDPADYSTHTSGRRSVRWA